MKSCPCDSSKQIRYLDCCGAFIQNKNFATTPEALMRSRYTAYVEKKPDYIKKTMREPASLNFNKKDVMERASVWLGLEIIESTMHDTDPNIGYVEFKAKYRKGNLEKLIHEKSEFHRIDGRWYYVDGQQFSLE